MQVRMQVRMRVRRAPPGAVCRVWKAFAAPVAGASWRQGFVPARSRTSKERLMYDVIVLAEQAMSAGDAAEVASLHDGIEEPRHYHVLIPCENAALRVETALGAL